MEEANKFPAVSHTNVPLLSVVVRHHILEGSQLVGQSLNQLVAQSVSLLGQSVSQSVSQSLSYSGISKDTTTPCRSELHDKQSFILQGAKIWIELPSKLKCFGNLEIFKENTLIIQKLINILLSNHTMFISLLQTKSSFMTLCFLTLFFTLIINACCWKAFLVSRGKS